ncbi:hypothetical protein GP486_000929 [Trichoglossum hirsutum]|uniref:Uncharacterized protein n=1 Tax=Trichoglossum hirsutum TaxID=265104 RepID=A0A9P8LI05_9PEZI|nr:hypothetical protein GP486_000929 [Trichoglossum hirsutum]
MPVVVHERNQAGHTGHDATSVRHQPQHQLEPVEFFLRIFVALVRLTPYRMITSRRIVPLRASLPPDSWGPDQHEAPIDTDMVNFHTAITSTRQSSLHLTIVQMETATVITNIAAVSQMSTCLLASSDHGQNGRLPRIIQKSVQYVRTWDAKPIPP